MVQSGSRILVSGWAGNDASEWAIPRVIAVAAYDQSGNLDTTYPVQAPAAAAHLWRAARAVEESAADSQILAAASASTSFGFGYAFGIGGLGYDASSRIAADSQGNCYLLGEVDSSTPAAIINPLDPLADPVKVSGAFLAKYDASGHLLWSKELTTWGSIAVGADSSLYFAMNSPGLSVAKVNSLTGDFERVVSIPGATGEEVSDIVVGAGQQVYLTGRLGSNSFVAKLDWNTRQVLWRKEIVGAKSYAVAVDGYGNVWTTGEFSGSVDFNPGSGKFLLTSTRGYPDMFVCKLDAAGSFAWAGRAGGDNVFTVGNDLAVDGQGNVYVAGTFFLNFSNRQSKVDFDPGAGKYTLSTTKTSAYVLKLNNQGDFVWADGLNGAGATGLAIDADSNLYATGSMSGTVDFDPGAGQYNMVGNKDAYIWKLDNAGKLVWAAMMGGSDPPQGSDYPNAVSVDALGNVFATGSFATRRDAYEDFDPTSGVAPLQSAGGYGSGPDPAAEGSTDLFVVKLTQPSSLSGSLAVSASERLKRTDLLAAASSALDLRSESVDRFFSTFGRDRRRKGPDAYRWFLESQ